jgi:hypothetical protein
MHILESVELTVIQEHLKRKGTGVKLDPKDLPDPLDAHRGYRAILDEADIQRLVLWWEFQKVTTDESCRVVDLFKTAASQERVRSFMDGNDEKGFGPFDLRTAQGREPVIVTDKRDGPILYCVDGNHRLMAQYFSQKPFQDGRVLVWMHPRILNWAYVPGYWKRSLGK